MSAQDEANDEMRRWLTERFKRPVYPKDVEQIGDELTKHLTDKGLVPFTADCGCCAFVGVRGTLFGGALALVATLEPLPSQTKATLH